MTAILHALILMVALTAACKREEKFDDIGDKVSGPIDAATNSSGTHFYILNSDFTRDYNEGSILVLNEAGDKVKAVATPRLGRFLVVAGNDLIVGFDREDEEKDIPKVQLYDISNPEDPILKAEFEVEDPPLNAAIQEGYDHFVVTTLLGKMYVGTLKPNREETELKLVRDYGRPRRAIFLDTARELVFTFTLDIREQTLTDATYDDVMTYDAATDQLVEGENEVPDLYEDSRRARRQAGDLQQIYQFVVYDIGAEKSVSPELGGPFPERTLEDSRENADSYEIVKKELRWMYYPLFDDGGDSTPDTDAGFLNNDQKTYHTNFWHAERDPDDADAFYLSQRNPPSGSYNTGNNVVRIQLTGDPKVDASGKVPKTRQYFEVERVYGNAGEIDLDPKLHYPGDFDVVYLQGQKTLILNHFRDLVYFNPGDRRYSIVAKDLDTGFWRNELMSSDPNTSYYQMAVNQRGVAMSCSFYGNSVIRLVVSPGADIKEDKRIN